jgi:hypothetical protein
VESLRHIRIRACDRTILRILVGPAWDPHLKSPFSLLRLGDHGGRRRQAAAHMGSAGSSEQLAWQPSPRGSRFSLRAAFART